MENLLRKIENNHKETKNQIENLLEKGYLYICELRQKSLNQELNQEYIKEAEDFFQKNQINNNFKFPNKYLTKYAYCLHKFWSSYTLQLPQISIDRNKFNLFESLIENDLILKNHNSESHCAFILGRMEEYWIASNQIYKKYEISLIRKKYMR